MERTDYILISRDSIIYKARFDLLSSVICFKEQKKVADETFDDLSIFIEDSYKSFSDTHYTKSEMKSDFCTIETITNLTANTTYALKTLANAKAAQLSSKDNLETWKEEQDSGCFAVLSGEYGRMKEMIDWKPREGATVDEYMNHIPKSEIIYTDDGDYPISQ